MPKPDMNAMLKRRMAATQQASELQVGNEVYEKLFEPVPASSPMIRDLPVDKLRPFFTADIGFHPYPKDKLVAFSKQLAEEGLLERIIVRRIAGSDSYEILAGHNRTAAWRLTGNTTISAEIVNADDARAIIIATATNLLRRQDLTIIERGKAYKAMLDDCPPPSAQRQKIYASWREARAAAEQHRKAPPRKITFDRKKFAPYLDKLGSEKELEELFLEFLRERVC